MKLLTVEYDEESGCILLTIQGTEDDALELDHLIDSELFISIEEGYQEL